MPSAASPSERFSFRGAFAERAKKEIAKYPEGRRQSAVLALLDLAQRQNKRTNCVTDAAIDTIAAMLSMTRLRLEEVAESLAEGVVLSVDFAEDDVQRA